MKSAYLVLGVPGNASTDDIDDAFAKARQFYSPDRLANTPGALEKFQQVKVAYEVLREPSSRAAHDRKLAAGSVPRARTIVVEEEPGLLRRYLPAIVILVAIVAASASWISYQRAQERQFLAEQERIARQQEAQERERQRAEAERQEQARAQARAKAEQDDRRLALEGRVIGAMASSNVARQEAQVSQQQRMAAMESQRQQANMAAEERRAAMEAQRRLAMDKQRIRELCYMQYRRYDC